MSNDDTEERFIKLDFEEVLWLVNAWESLNKDLGVNSYFKYPIISSGQFQTVEFCPDEPEVEETPDKNLLEISPPESPLDDLRRQLFTQENLPNNSCLKPLEFPFPPKSENTYLLAINTSAKAAAKPN
jgi:hypothetical protein